MTKFMQRYRKQMLAVFMAGLMVTFLIGGYSGRSGKTEQILWGKTGKKPIYVHDVELAKEQWRALSQVYSGGRPITEILDIGGQVINFKPEMFLLLSLEAERLGMEVDAQQVEQVLERVRVIDPDQAVRPASQSQRVHLIRPAMRRLFLIAASFERATSAIKASVPAREAMLAQLGQQLDINYIEFAATDQAGKVPAPTKEQLEKHFYDHNRESENPGPVAVNPLGFGYRYSDRVKCQFIEIPREAIRQQVESRKTAAEWDREASKLYFSKLSDWRYEVGDDPLTQSPFSIGRQPLAMAESDRSRPTTRPLAEAMPELKTKLMAKPMDELQRQIEKSVRDTMAADYRPYAAESTTQPTSRPSSLGAPYTSMEYLRALADRIQKDFGILPKVASYAERPLGSKELSKLEGIGSATVGDNRKSFSDWVLATAEGLSQPVVADPLRLYQPSPLLTGKDASTYIVRVTETRKQSMPESIDEVKDQVVADWKLAQAYDLARKAAEDAVSQAKTVGSLQSVANSLNKPMRTLDNVSPIPTSVAKLGLNPVSAQSLISDLYEKLLIGAASESHPRTVIELPRDVKVLTVELEKIRPEWNEQRPREEIEVREAAPGAVAASMQRFMYAWFSLDPKGGVIERLGVQLESPDRWSRASE